MQAGMACYNASAISFLTEEHAMPLAIIVHGGAGHIAPARFAVAQQGCAAAAQAGWGVLRAGGSALEAVTAAVVSLEDNPTFNAGTGAVLTREGHAELDAGIMDGATLDVGAVAGVRRVKNPILLAREVLKMPQVLLLGDGAEAVAEQQAIPLVDPQHFVDAYRRASSQPLPDDTEPPLRAEGKHGTVGAVALDAAGHIVAAASTGGMANKPPGRVGDTPIAGAGFYAEDGVGGVSCTGQGEAFIRLVVARRACEAMERGAEAQAAADAVIAQLGARTQMEGGLIVIDASGHIGFARNTPAMSYAFCTEGMAAPQAGI
jgi:beta-aspartyl-peptidase (threonine type)